MIEDRDDQLIGDGQQEQAGEAICDVILPAGFPEDEFKARVLRSWGLAMMVNAGPVLKEVFE